MPFGIIVNALSILLGGLIGASAKKYIPQKLKESLPLIFGFSSIAIGISLIVNLKNLPAVVLSIILGTIIGELLCLEERITKVSLKLQTKLSKESLSSQNDNIISDFISILILFCASGTGVFGALNEGMTGEHSILLAKSILDFFTAIIFATTVGYLISLIAIPQFCLFILLYLGSSFLIPLISPVMISDFKACGGIIALIAGFNICKIKNVRLTNTLPSLIIVMPLSYLWSICIL